MGNGDCRRDNEEVGEAVRLTELKRDGGFIRFSLFGSLKGMQKGQNGYYIYNYNNDLYLKAAKI